MSAPGSQETAACSLHLALHDVVACLTSDAPDFLTYARDYLADVLFPEGTVTPVAPSVLTRLHWHATPPAEWDAPQVRHWGRRLLQDGPRLLLGEVLPVPGLQIEVYWGEDVLHVEAYYRPKWSTQQMLRLNSARRQLFSALVYYLVYFPLLHYLEQMRDWHLMHAAAVATPEGDYLLAGLPGSGKTTLALYALGDPRSQLLSDNLLLYDTEQVYACPEVLHLSPASEAMLTPAGRDRLMGSGEAVSYGRSDYRILSEARAWQAAPQTLFITQLGERTTTQPLPSGPAHDRLLAFDRMAKEIMAYEQFVAALEPVARRPGCFTRRQMALQALFSRLVCYDLTVERGNSVEGAAREIAQRLRRSVPAAPSAVFKGAL